MPPFVVQKQIDIKAAPSAVWDALTNPEKTKQYFFHCKVFSDWRAGSPIAFKGRMFFIIKIELSGKILQIVPEKLLQYTLDSKDGSQSTVTDKLSYKNGVTTLSITDDVGQGEGAEQRYNRSVKGWDKILKGLQHLVENG